MVHSWQRPVIHSEFTSCETRIDNVKPYLQSTSEDGPETTKNDCPDTAVSITDGTAAERAYRSSEVINSDDSALLGWFRDDAVSRPDFHNFLRDEVTRLDLSRDHDRLMHTK
jgi:hypothetical protein